MEVSVLDKKGSDTGRKVTLSDGIYGVEPNDHVIYLDVKQYLANQRQGTHKSKEKWEIVGSTKKLKKQKGTGTARAGSIKSPVFRGGGRVFGPQPRNYSFKLNKKVKTLARKSALSYKLKEENVVVVEELKLSAPRTKDYVSFLKALSLEGKKSLFIIGSDEKNTFLSSRNVEKANVISAESLNTYDVLNADKLIISEGSIAKIEELFN